MTPIFDIRRGTGAAPAGAPVRKAAAACLCVVLLHFGVGDAAFAQQRSDASPSRDADVPPERYRQQPNRERTRDLLRQEEALPDAEERREELRTLNRIYRDLVPPGPGTVPAPRLAPEQAPRGDR